MRSYIVLAVIIGSAFAIPIETIEDIDGLQRTKKSSFAATASGFPGSSQLQREDEHTELEHKARSYDYASLSGLSAGAGAYGAGLNSGVSLSGAGGYGGSGLSSSVGVGGGYSGAAGGYSGLNNVGLAAAGGNGYSGSGVSGLGAGLHGAVLGPAVGVFPNAHVGGCNVPLLLSCSPSVVSGHLAASHHAYSAPAYRSFEEDIMKEAEWAQARKASHHKVSEDFPEPHPGNHHVVSQDYPEPNLTRLVPVHAHNEAAVKH